MKDNRQTKMCVIVENKTIEFTNFQEQFQYAKEAIAWNEARIKTKNPIIFPQALKYWKKVFIALEKLGIQNNYTLNYI